MEGGTLSDGAQCVQRPRGPWFATLKLSEWGAWCARGWGGAEGAFKAE